ncbi:MAG: DNA recombination/repair protein RecA, partial [Lentisphaeria bacterium]|nr:DNA recombination/repair protein RecA [Lentisphaeria bacterium]
VIKSGEQVLGNRARVKVIKNKMAPPFKVAEFDIMYNEGISKVGSLIDVATDLGLLEKRGSWFSFEGEQLGQGRDQVKVLLSENAELRERITAKIMETLHPAAAAAEEAESEK